MVEAEDSVKDSLSVNGGEMWSLKEVMESKNLAVIGASRDPLKPGAVLIKTLMDTGFEGKIAGVNSGGGEIHGHTLYPTLDEIPFDVDIAVMLIPPKAIPNILRACARKGVKGVVITSEGFAEAGEEGRKYQEEVKSILIETGMRAFGPNTLGIVNTSTGLTTSYFTNRHMLKPGSIGFAAQSGIFVGALLRYLGSFDGLRISKGIGLGNKVDVDESDVLEYLTEDEQTRTIGMYLEDIRDGRRFLEAAKAAAAKKPVLMLKGGRTSRGARATASHTASLAVDDSVFDGAMRQAGVLRMENIDEMVASLMGFEWMPMPKGNRIALVTFSGAQAIMSIDAAMSCGLDIAQFSDETAQRLSKVIATPSKALNPIDIFPDMMKHGFEKTTVEITNTLLEDDGVHGIIFISFADAGAEPLYPFAELVGQNSKKPVFVSLLGRKEDVRESREYLLKQLIPCYSFPETGVKVFSHMHRYSCRKTETKGIQS